MSGIIVIEDSGSDDDCGESNKTSKSESIPFQKNLQNKNAFNLEEENDTLHFKELKDLLNSTPEPFSAKNSKKKGPVCCNSWCFNLANVVPEEVLRDYYNIPPGKSNRVCDDCINVYHKFLITADKNLETKGDMLEGRCAGVNEFVVLDNESDEEDDDDEDPELIKLLGNAISECLNDIDKENNIQEVFERSTEQVVQKLEKCILDSCQLISKMGDIERDLYQSSEEFKNAFKPRSEAKPDLDIPFAAFETVHKPKILTRNSSNALDEEDVNVLAAENEPADLPSFGEMLKSPPRVGDKFYAMGNEEYSEWILFTITNVIYDSDDQDNLIETCSIETMVGDEKLTKTVRCDMLAYMEIPKVRLGIGSRVIAAFNNNCDVGLPKKFFSGMVAELPTRVNDFRYLVFFDDGKAQYSPHRDLRVVYKPLKKIHEYFSWFQAEFIKHYLNNFPVRPMVKAEINHFVRIELNGFWVSGKIDKVDGSLLRVTIQDEHHGVEWIYRGSPRLRPVYDKWSKDIQAGVVRESVPLMRPRVKVSTNVRGVVFAPSLSTEEIVIGSSDEEDSSASHSVRAVAKKSTSRQIYQTVIKRTSSKRSARASVVCRLPPNMLSPNPYHFHKCSRACVNWVNYSESKTQKINPLAIPSIFAFKRVIDVTSAVSYTGPCGKKLKNIQEVLKYLSETLIPLTLDMFDFDIRTQIFDEFNVLPQYVIMEDISFGGEKNPIPCINELDYECPDLMSYMTERRPLAGVHINLDPGFLVCCDCEDNCRDRSKCKCWRLTVDCFKPFNIDEDRRHITKIGYQYQRLDQNLLSGIYECNSSCKCNKVTCINRVAQHPMRHKLQLFKTPKKGWGTRCVNDIPQGVFICTYVGNIMTEPSANETGTINGDEYFAELDHIEVMEENKANYEAQAAKMTDEESEEESLPVMASTSSTRAVRSCTQRKRKHNTTPSKPPPQKKPIETEISPAINNDSDEEKDSVRQFYGPNETVYVMDAKIAGNIGRYFNHSCDPNIFVQNVYVDTHDLRFPWVAFFALRHIPAGTELTWDYGYKIGSVPGKILYCYCGSSNCRKRLL